MRFFSILLAVVVMTALFLFVLQRDALLGFAGIRAEEAEIGETAMSPEADAPDAVAPVTERRVSIVAVTSTAQTVENAIVLRGRTEALRQVTALAETSGRVVSEPLRKGSQVEAGQIMCQLDPGSRGANLAEAEARLLEARARVPEAESRVTEAAARFEEARINENAARRLAADGFASESRVAGADAALASAQSAVSSAITGLETVKAGIQSAEASVERAAQDITLLTITAPFAGVLETDTAEFGAFLNTQGGNANCGTILQLDPIKLVGFVPEADIELVQVGARAGAQLASGREVSGLVTFLSRSADLTTRTFRTEIEIDNSDLSIRDGQTATIGIAAEGTPAHLIAASALTLNDSGELGVRHAVATDNGHEAAFAPVTLLRDTAEGVWVTGLPETADVIVVGQEYVTEGTLITVTYREDDA